MIIMIHNINNIYEDNQSFFQIIEKENINPKSKNIDVKYYFVKDLLNNKTKYEYGPTDQKEMLQLLKREFF